MWLAGFVVAGSGAGGEPDNPCGAPERILRINVMAMTKSNPRLGGPSYGLSHRLTRVLWGLVWGLLAAWTPAPLHRWRRLVLLMFGAKIASSAHVYPSVRIWNPANLEMGPHSCLGPRVDCYSMAKIYLGAHATVSQDARLCAGSHDIADPGFKLVARPITIGAHAWIAAGAFVGPGVTVGEGAVLGAQAVAFRDLPAWSVHVGNPATFLKARVRSPGLTGAAS
jgi:putative colanic acid biosynthesis acetyltransferase WcaF